MTLDQHPSRRPAALIGGGLLALALALGTSACGSDSDSGDGGSAATSAQAPAGGSEKATGTTQAATSEAAESDDAATATCVKNSDYLSGTSTVIWTPDGKSEHQVAETKADNKFTLTAAGKLDPATITVAVDEVFTVTMADDSEGISVLKIGCDGGQTMTKGTPAGIYITAPGTYAVTSGLADDPAGTIVVE